MPLYRERYEALRRCVVDVLDAEIGDDVPALRRMLQDALSEAKGPSSLALTEDEGELLASECKRYGLPVGLAGLLRHIYGNRDTTLGALTMAADKWQARAEEAETALTREAELRWKDCVQRNEYKELLWREEQAHDRTNARAEEAERSVGLLEEALREVLEWPLPHGTVETWALSNAMADRARAALVRTGEEHGTEQIQEARVPRASGTEQAP